VRSNCSAFQRPSATADLDDRLGLTILAGILRCLFVNIAHWENATQRRPMTLNPDARLGLDVDVAAKFFLRSVALEWKGLGLLRHDR
jgi:hypothetical protein